VLTTAAGWAAELEVEIRGIDGDLLRNVRTGLSLTPLQKRKDLRGAAVRRAAGLAEEEIRRALQPFGFYNPRIRSGLELEDGAWHAEYWIDPGLPTLLEHLRLSIVGAGAEEATFIRSREQFPLHPGDQLRHAVYERGKRAIELAAAEQGYLDGQFRVHRLEVEPERDRAQIELIYDTGPQFLYGPVRFEESGLAPEFLLGHVPFAAGDPIRYSELLQLQKSLGRLSYFSRVEVAAARNQARENRVPIDVGLTLAPARRYTLRGGYGTDTGPRGACGVEFRRIGSRAHRADVELQASLYESHVEAQYVIPWPYPHTEVVTLSLGYSSLYEEYATARALRAGVDLGRSRGRLREEFSFSYEREDFHLGVDRGLSSLLLPGARWARVWADDRLDPRRGVRLQLRLRGAREGVLATTSLAQLDAEGKWIRTAADHLRGIARLRIATTRVADFHSLPPSLRYFAGGTDSVRGYSHSSLSPRDGNGDRIGAPHLLIGALELEWLLTEHWGWALFSDGGDAMERWEGAFGRLHYGAGSGIRWRSPIGLIRADLGWPLGAPGGPEFHLALGPEL
jgi:translocation and assembly module TamA